MNNFFISTLFLLSAYSSANGFISIKRDSFIQSEGNTPIFSLTVKLSDENGNNIFNQKLSRNETLESTLEEGEYFLVLNFYSKIHGLVSNEYSINMADSERYFVTIGKPQSLNSTNVSSKRFYGYGISEIKKFVGNKPLNSSPDRNQSIKNRLRNLTLLFEQGVISQEEYLERREIVLQQK